MSRRGRGAKRGRGHGAKIKYTDDSGIQDKLAQFHLDVACRLTLKTNYIFISNMIQSGSSEAAVAAPGAREADPETVSDGSVAPNQGGGSANSEHAFL